MAPRKSVKKKLDEAMEIIASQLPKVSEDSVTAKEIEEAVQAVAEAVDSANLPVEKVRDTVCVGHHPITKEKVYL